MTDPSLAQYSEKDVYRPDSELEFDADGRLLIYRCRDEALKQAKFEWFPNTMITVFGGIMFYKAFIAYTSVLWVILPLPVILLQW